MPKAVGLATFSLFLVGILLTYNVRFNVNPVSTTPFFILLTIIFITSGSILVGYITARAYLRERLPSMLFLGAAALVFGLTSLIAAVSSLMSSGRVGTNEATTVFITGVAFSAIAHLLSIGSRNAGEPSKPGSRALLTLELSIVVAVVGVATVIAFSGMLPTFFVPGVGITAIAKAMLVLAITGMAFAAVAVLRPAFGSPVLCWYCSALAMTSLGLAGILFSDWIFEAADFLIGRLALSVAGLFLVLSLRSAETMERLDADSAVKEIFKPLLEESPRPAEARAASPDASPTLYERSMLLEVDSSSSYERAVRAFADEMSSTGREVFVFTMKGSALHSSLHQTGVVRLFVLSDVSYPKPSGTHEVLVPATDLPVMLSVINEIVAEKREPRKAIVFDNISSLILEKGFPDVYKFLKQMNEMVTGGDVVTMVIMLAGAHDDQTVNLVRNLYAGQLGYDSSGLRSKKRH